MVEKREMQIVINVKNVLVDKKVRPTYESVAQRSDG